MNNNSVSGPSPIVHLNKPRTMGEIADLAQMSMKVVRRILSKKGIVYERGLKTIEEQKLIFTALGVPWKI